MNIDKILSPSRVYDAVNGYGESEKRWLVSVNVK